MLKNHLFSSANLGGIGFSKSSILCQSAFLGGGKNSNCEFSGRFPEDSHLLVPSCSPYLNSKNINIHTILFISYSLSLLGHPLALCPSTPHTLHVYLRRCLGAGSTASVNFSLRLLGPLGSLLLLFLTTPGLPARGVGIGG
ncbi:hypothetical protein P9112_006752 [Eukaryota sp. TZLM1-RC]